MKKLFLLFAFFGLFALVNVQAQNCPHAKKTSEDKVCNYSKSAASKAAVLDDNIIEKIDAKTGTASFVKQTVSAESGRAIFTDVEYCNKSGKFISTSAGKKSCCAKGGGKASKVANEKTKNCTDAQKAACCKSKGTKTSAG